jgi:glycerate-2-kinase
LEASGWAGFCIAAVDTDGTDGPTAFAGGLADGQTVGRARDLGINIYDRLADHDSAGVFQALGDMILTGNTGTNVCDLNVIYVGPEA